MVIHVLKVEKPPTNSRCFPNIRRKNYTPESQNFFPNNMDELKPTRANSTPLTPLSFLERTALVYGDCPSIIYNTTTYTWSETRHRCLQAASAITTMGIKRKQVVSVVAPNVPAAYELHFAVPMAGAILNNINTRLNSITISTLLHHSESKLVFVYHELCSLVLEAVSLLPSEHPHPLLILISDNDDNSPTPGEFWGSYEDLLKGGDPVFKWIAPESEWDPIVLNYTSGTTSSPKGVVHCHRGTYISALDAVMDWSVPKQAVYLWVLSMFHVNGWAFTWGMAAVGATNICLRQFDGAKIHDLIRRYQVTHLCAAPVVLNMLTDKSNTAATQILDHPVHVLTAGSPPPASVILRAEALGFVVSHGYGLTETGGVTVSCAWKPKWNGLSANERAQLRARQGVRTLAMTAVDVVDPTTNKPVSRDGKTNGEIVQRGSCIMLGYFKNPQATLNCMGDDGWFRTGDLGVMHTDGYIMIKDRSKDIIISGGENISSVEVESVLYTFPGVNEAAVVAQPHEFWGETPCAFVCFNTEVKVRPTEKEIIDFCRDRLPHYMVPKKVIFKDDLPKTATGKIKKLVLREIARAMIMGPAKSSRL